MYNTIPQLKRPEGAKEMKQWVEDIAKFVSGNMSIYTSNDIRASVRDKIVNLDLYNNRLHPEDFVSLLNPLDLKTIDHTRELEHFPVAASIIDLLVGEEIDRPFEPNVGITNNIGIAEKRERLKAYVESKIAELEKEFDGDKEILKEELKKFTRYLKYTYKDMVEKKASALYTHYREELDMDEKFVEGFRRVWLTGEEAYEIDIINGEPTFEVVNTSNMRVYGGGRSNKIEDYDLIVIESHFAPGHLIDRYGSMLSKDEVDRIVNYETNTGIWDKTYGNVTHEFNPVGQILGTEISDNFIDDSGCIRHLRIRFKAYKQIKKIAYQDPATGEEQIKIVAKKYRVKEGEALVATEWITEWWICTLIGADIVVDAKPIPVRYNRLSSPSEGHPGIVGTIYNINEREVVPPMSKIRSYQYLFDVVMDRVIVAMSKNIGPVIEMDFARKPNKWTTTKWLDYMFKYNTKFIDNFKEISKGKHTGQLAGNLASGRDQQQNFDFSGYIQQLLNIAEYLEKSMADTLGVVPQRLGAISTRENVGSVERATAQSSHITEWYNYRHQRTKLRALNIFIEAAKTALKDNPKKLANILDQKIHDILEVTEDDFANVDLGVTATNSRKSQEYKEALKQGSLAFMQNGGEFSFIFDVLNSESMAEKRRLIEEYEDDKRSQAREEAANQNKAIQAQIAAEQDDKQKDRDLKKYEVDVNANVELQKEAMKHNIQISEEELNRTRTLAEIKNDILELNRKMRADADSKDTDDKKIELQKQEIKVKEKALNKPQVKQTK